MNPEPLDSPEGKAAPLTAALEALLFAADRPLTVGELAGWTGWEEHEVEGALFHMARALDEPSRGIRLVREAGGWRLLSKPEWGELLRRAFHPEEEPRPLSRAALEVLAIIAYKQPISRIEVDEIRGVRSDRAIARLVDEGLVEIAGRSDGLGRPFLYRTTPKFLEFIGLETLDHLPPLDEGEVPGQLHIPRGDGSR